MISYIRCWLSTCVIVLFGLSATTVAQTTFGDTLFSFNAGALTTSPDRALLGIEFAEGHFWVTGMNPPAYDHRLYKISADGSAIISSTTLGSGYHAYLDLAYDGQFLYAVDRDAIVQIDPATSQLTGQSIPVDFDYLLAQGLAYDPANDHFWVIPQRNGQLQVIYQIDRAGNIINTYPNRSSDYTVALAWDNHSPQGPFLWTFSREPVGFDNRGIMRQFSPATGTFTGVSIEMATRSPLIVDSPLGMAFTDELDTSTAAIVTLQAGALSSVTDGLDWVVGYDADLSGQSSIGPQLVLNPASIQVQVLFGDTVDIPLSISNNGATTLEWQSYIESSDTSGASSATRGDTLFSSDLVNAIGNPDLRFYGVAEARGYFWLSGYSFQTQQRSIFKVDRQGNLLATYPQPTFNGSGWSAIATDGDHLYGTNTYYIDKWSIDSLRSVGVILTGSISADAMTYDPQGQHFYVSGPVGAIFVIDRHGNDVALLTTAYQIEGLAWDRYSPGGPFLWAWVEDSLATGGNARALQLDPETGQFTGISFDGRDFGSEPLFPEAATVYSEDNKLVFAALQKDDQYGINVSYLSGYDLAEVPPPAWIEFPDSSAGQVMPQAQKNLTVRIHGMMSDTTTSAVVRLKTNDLDQPEVLVPVDITMLENTVSAITDDNPKLDGFVLKQNYPNPFNPTTTIEFTLPAASVVTLQIYDILGRQVETPYRASLSAGTHKFVWNGTDAAGNPVASGVYIYRITSGQTTLTRKMLLIE